MRCTQLHVECIKWWHHLNGPYLNVFYIVFMQP